jgi:hypothetical protein
MNYTVSGIANLIKQMELDLGLLKDETYGLDARHIWEAIRYDFQSSLNRKLSLHGQAHTLNLRIHRMSGVALFCFIGRYLYSIIIKNWLWAPKQREWLIFQHPRRRKFSGGYEDIYTDDLIDEIGVNKCVVIEKSYQRRHYTPGRHQSYHLDFLFLFSKFVAFFLLSCSKFNLVPINNMMNDIKRYVENNLGQRIQDLWILSRFRVNSIYVNYVSYLFMLKWLRPKKILLVVSYGFQPLIWAASTLHIPTVEVQHGVITSEHLGYSVPVNMTKKLFPDYLLLFGNYWKEIMDNFPLSPERLVVFGYPYFERMVTGNSFSSPKEDQIVVISQGTIGFELSEFAVKLASIKKGIYKVIYKLHPGEWGRVQTLYTDLYKAKEKGLLEVVDTDTPSLYTLFSQSRWQIGVNSTALYEGIAFGCQLILVDLPGVEYLAPLIKERRVQLVKTPEEIYFNQHENSMTLREELFASGWRSNWQNFEQMDLQCRY